MESINPLFAQAAEEGVALMRSLVREALSFFRLSSDRYTAVNDYRAAKELTQRVNSFDSSYFDRGEEYRYIPHLFKVSYLSNGNGGAVWIDVDVDENLVAFVGIKEPLKVRPISKGSFPLNGCWQDVQVAMWKKLMQFPQFDLIGHPMNASHVQWLETRTRELVGDLANHSYNSGDYKGATNTIHQEVTREVCRELFEDQTISRLVETNLCDTTLMYDFPLKEVRSDEIHECLQRIYDVGGYGYPLQWKPACKVLQCCVKQRRGQLMGSKFSFPILCIINFAVNRLVYERKVGRTLGIHEVPVLINGDDNLSLLTDSDYLYWQEAISYAGFEMSVGKNYFARNFAFLNSNYSFARKVPYVNVNSRTSVS
jgi:hypothetical protein